MDNCRYKTFVSLIFLPVAYNNFGILSIIDGNWASTGSANGIYRTLSLSKGTFTLLF